MAHLVNRRGYLSLEESYREGTKVRKRVIEYYGKRPVRLRDIGWRASLIGDPGEGAASKAEWDANAALKEETAKETAPAETAKDAAEPAADAASEPNDDGSDSQ